MGKPVKVPVVEFVPAKVKPFEAVTVQFPLAGKPLNCTLPVARVHVGCVMVPIVGAVGVTGWVINTAALETLDVQPF